MKPIGVEEDQGYVPCPWRRVVLRNILVDDNFESIRWFLGTSSMSAREYTRIHKRFNDKVCCAHGREE